MGNIIHDLLVQVWLEVVFVFVLFSQKEVWQCPEFVSAVGLVRNLSSSLKKATYFGFEKEDKCK